VTFNREQLDERSRETSKVLLEVQQRAVLLGNKVQLEQVKQRLNASRTSILEGTQEHQETSGGDTRHMTRPYSTPEPSVNILTDAEIGKLLENRQCSIPTMTYQGETLHSF
jgi:hypothetical protein